MGWSGPMTHRQFDAWQEWFELDLEKPDRHDFYAMQIAAKIEGIFKNNVDINSMKMSFQKPIDPKDLPPDDPDGPKRLRTKEDVQKAQEKINIAMRLYQAGALREKK